MGKEKSKIMDLNMILEGEGARRICENSQREVKKRWDLAAKPLDSLGAFETITAKIGGILGTPDFSLRERAIVTFCADNGVVEENISQSGQEITLAVSRAMGAGSSNIAKLARLSNAKFIPVDIGINSSEKIPGLLDKKVSLGTKNFAKEPAMSREECVQAMEAGFDIARDLKNGGCELVGIGEMGIGNTTTTVAVCASLLKVKAADIVGRGAGLSKETMEHKAAVIQNAIDKYDLYNESPFEVLRHVGGYDIAAMTGLILGGAANSLPVVLDGVITAAAALLAEKILKGAGKGTIASHISREKSAKIMLDKLQLTPVIYGDMALGEGTGAAMFFSLLDHVMTLYSTPITFKDMEIEAYTRFDSEAGNIV